MPERKCQRCRSSWPTIVVEKFEILAETPDMGFSSCVWKKENPNDDNNREEVMMELLECAYLIVYCSKSNANSGHWKRSHFQNSRFLGPLQLQTIVQTIGLTWPKRAKCEAKLSFSSFDNLRVLFHTHVLHFVHLNGLHPKYYWSIVGWDCKKQNPKFVFYCQKVS